MSKHFRFLVLALMLVGMTAGSAFAGTVMVSHGATNTSFTAALEALGTGAARNVQIVGVSATAANHAIQYTLGQDLTSGNLVTVTFTGAAFDGSALGICASNGVVGGTGNFIQIATATPTANAASWNFQTNVPASANVAAGTRLFLTTNAACNAAGAINVPLRLTTMASAGMATVSFAINTAGNVPVDPATAAGNLAVVAAEYTAAMNAASNHTVDYLASGATGTQLLVNGSAGGNSFAYFPVAFVTKVNYNLNAVNSAVGAINAGLTAGVVITAADSASWQGVTKAYVTGINAAVNVNCTDNAGGNLIGSAAPNGTLTFTVPAAAFNASSAAANYGLCVVVNGTTALNTRSITTNGTITITGTNANSPAAGATGVQDTWGLNAYQAMIPWAVNSSSIPTYCLINNAGATNVSVVFDVLSSEGSVTASNNALGTINARTSKLMTITDNNVSLAGGSNVSLSTLGADKRHMDRITVTGAPANVNSACIQTDPTTGGKRNVLTVH